MHETSIEEILEAKCGNSETMSKVLENNVGLIWSIVKRFSGRGYELEDLYQIGCMGFVKSIKRFDENYNVKLSTFAVPYILGEIKRFIRDDGIIKVSRSIKELVIKIKEVENNYLEKNGESITISKLAEILNVSEEEISIAIDSSRQVESINEEIYEEGNVSRGDIISNNIDEASVIVDRITLKNAIKSLNKREKEIILLRYYKEKTQTQVAKILGISQVQVSRIEKKVLMSMREKLAI